MGGRIGVVVPLRESGCDGLFPSLSFPLSFLPLALYEGLVVGTVWFLMEEVVSKFLAIENYLIEEWMG